MKLKKSLTSTILLGEGRESSKPELSKLSRVSKVLTTKGLWEEKGLLHPREVIPRKLGTILRN